MFSIVQPSFILVGSIPEGTRIGYADELDLSIQHDGFKADFFEAKAKSGMGLNLTQKGIEFFTKEYDSMGAPLEKFVMNGVEIDFLEFKKAYLKEIQKGLQGLADEGSIPSKIQLGTMPFDARKCKGCKKASGLDTSILRFLRKNKTDGEQEVWKHCNDCLPLLTQSKKGIVPQCHQHSQRRARQDEHIH